VATAHVENGGVRVNTTAALFIRRASAIAAPHDAGHGKEEMRDLDESGEREREGVVSSISVN